MKNAIEISGLGKQYSNFSLQNIEFSVPQGSIVGFVGENGAGKTTTIKCILDVVHKSSGSILLFGEDNVRFGAKARAEIGVVFDECSFHDWLRAEQVGNILKNVYPTWDEALFNQLLARFGLAGLTKRKDIIKTYSRGMKMKLSLAAAMAHRPKLLILDEATSGLDPVVRDEILDLFLEFIQDEEHSILFSSHITSDIEKAADYLVFIHKGGIVLNAPKDELLDQYGIIHCSKESYSALGKALVVGSRTSQFGVDALVNNRHDISLKQEGILLEKATIDDIMLFTIKGNTL